MKTPANKMQQPATSIAGVCGQCAGKGHRITNGEKVTCLACRGTGQAKAGGYQTK
jgi:DnaJ-class molecular chaperone